MHMICRQRVADFPTWKSVFDSHAAAQQAAGLFVQNVWRNRGDPKDIFFLFEVKDEQKARAFVTAPSAREALRKSKSQPPDIWFVD